MRGKCVLMKTMKSGAYKASQNHFVSDFADDSVDATVVVVVVVVVVDDDDDGGGGVDDCKSPVGGGGMIPSDGDANLN